MSIPSLRCSHCGEHMTDKQMKAACGMYLELQDAAWTERYRALEAKYDVLHRRFQAAMQMLAEMAPRSGSWFARWFGRAP